MARRLTPGGLALSAQGSGMRACAPVRIWRDATNWGKMMHFYDLPIAEVGP